MKKLKKYIQKLLPKGICVAFSGGLDSGILLKVIALEAEKFGGSLCALTFATELHTKDEIEYAKKFASLIGVRHYVLEVLLLENKHIVNNHTKRCYYCKKTLFEHGLNFCKSHNIQYLVEGTHSADLNEYRPGLIALKELNILSPWAELQMDKKQIRQIAHNLGLDIEHKVAKPCLATRFPYDTYINFDMLDAIAKGEDYLQHLGFNICRLRVHDDMARIELPPKDFTKFLENRLEIIAKLKALGFAYVTLDLNGFKSGNMDNVKGLI